MPSLEKCLTIHALDPADAAEMQQYIAEADGDVAAGITAYVAGSTTVFVSRPHCPTRHEGSLSVTRTRRRIDSIRILRLKKLVRLLRR